ncbi:MAG: polyphosphate kinase 2 [Alphaproteobacteria bacterium]|nr:polyphosphate kinase 2 [Alphaproteobacteria bacterium]MBL7097188.1 polyphosphate kinase 2 [Alphaproteobacteria bacterium]
MARKRTKLVDIDNYQDQLYALQVELVKLQRHLLKASARVLVILEGRDGAGKDGTIKRLTAHMSPRETRVHAPSKPSNREETQWYFQRFVPHLPSADEFVIFNRSWYNRAGVESVMGFATETQVETFLGDVVPFEAMLVRDGIHLRKYYLDITRGEQKKRLRDRDESPLKQWKISPIDAVATKKWKQYSKARDRMLKRTSHPAAPWHIVRSDHKKIARLEFLRDLLTGFDYPHKDRKLLRHDGEVVFPWSAEAHGRLAQ